MNLVLFTVSNMFRTLRVIIGLTFIVETFFFNKKCQSRLCHRFMLHSLNNLSRKQRKVITIIIIIIIIIMLLKG